MTDSTIFDPHPVIKPMTSLGLHHHAFTKGRVARIVEAGDTRRIGGFRPDRSLYLTAELPEDAPPDLVAELEREGWHIVRVASTDTAAWVGEAEDELPPAPDDGDEAVHGAWLAGTPSPCRRGCIHDRTACGANGCRRYRAPEIPRSPLRRLEKLVNARCTENGAFPG